jgi:hypothetical protein
MITPENYAGASESSQQIALFMWANMAKLRGFERANNMNSYDPTKFERCLENSVPDTVGIPELRWLHAIPNGGLRNKSTAGRLKAEGVKTGVVDIFWPYVPNVGRVYRGLYIEMKAPGKLNNTSKDQDEFIAYVCNQDYYAAVHDNWRDAANTIQAYYEGKL